MLPVFSLVNARKAEFPVLLRLIDALEEAFSLFVLRQVQKNLMTRVLLQERWFFQFTMKRYLPYPTVFSSSNVSGSLWVRRISDQPGVLVPPTMFVPSSQNVLFLLAELFLRRGIPTHIRSDNGPEVNTRKLRQWLNLLQVTPLYVESLNGKMREQCLNSELFYTLKDAQVMTDRWRTHHDTVRPHSSLGSQPHAPETVKVASWGRTW